MLARILRNINFIGYSLLSNTLLTDDNVENIHAKSQAKDKNGKVIKECNFTDVHLVKGKQTCYEGNFFDNTSSSSFTVSGASLDDSGFSKHF